MRVEIALCQIRPVPGRPEMNAERIADLIMSDSANVLIFPESFLSGYGTKPDQISDEIDEGIAKVSDLCRKYDKAVALGTAMISSRGTTNSLLFLSPDGDTAYDKIQLARFGIYAEEGYDAGSRLVMGSYHGLRFGMSICYDIYFPEILHIPSLRKADVNICVSAAAKPSAPFFEKILPARALENVTYLAFVNNVGPMAGLDMAGGSRALSPLGDEMVRCGDSEQIVRFTADTEELARARSVRRHLSDFRRDIDWNPV